MILLTSSINDKKSIWIADESLIIFIFLLLGFIISFSSCASKNNVKGQFADTSLSPVLPENDTIKNSVPVQQSNEAPALSVTNKGTNVIQDALPKAIDTTTEAQKRDLRRNWIQFIQVKKNIEMSNPSGGEFGITFEFLNNMDFKVEEADLRVLYYQKYQCIRTETVKLFNIPAHGSSKVKAPDDDHADRIDYQVRTVTSKDLRLCYSADKPPKNSDDPYLCE